MWHSWQIWLSLMSVPWPISKWGAAWNRYNIVKKTLPFRLTDTHTKACKKYINHFLHLVTYNKHFVFQFEMHINNKRYLTSQDFYQFRTPQGEIRIIMADFVGVWKETWRLPVWISNPCQYRYVGVSNMETYDPSFFVNWKDLIVW